MGTTQSEGHNFLGTDILEKHDDIKPSDLKQVIVDDQQK